MVRIRVRVCIAGFRKTRVFKKKPNPGGFLGFYWVLLVFNGFFSDEQCRMMSNIHGRGK